MQNQGNGECYIPQSRQQLLERCLAEGQLDAEEGARLRQFADRLAAYYHFQFHRLEENLKHDYQPFNPDLDPRLPFTTSLKPTDLEEKQANLLNTLTQTLLRANYRAVDWLELHRAIERVDLVNMKTNIDFDDYEQLIFFYRGQRESTGERKTFIWSRAIAMNVYSNVILGLKFRDREHFQAKKIDLDDLTCEPGRMYFYLYKDIPENDLELLLPNVQVGMNTFDRILVIVPAIGAAISVLIKIVPSILLLFGVLVFFTMGPSFAARFGVTESQMIDASPALLALMSVGLALGGFAYRQYDGYKNRRLRFLKTVTETLFFKSVATNASVFHSIIDAAEEEECKELLLIYYHVLVHNGTLSPTQLREAIQIFLRVRCGVLARFDVERSIARLRQLCAELPVDRADKTRTINLFSTDANGKCHVAPLPDACLVMEAMWNQAFHAPTHPQSPSDSISVG